MKRYIIKEREHAAGGLFELEITYYFDVFDTLTQKTIMTFTREYSAHYNGVGWADGEFSSLKKLEISEDEKFVLLFYTGKDQPEKVELPE